MPSALSHWSSIPQNLPYIIILDLQAVYLIYICHSFRSFLKFFVHKFYFFSLNLVPVANITCYPFSVSQSTPKRNRHFPGTKTQCCECLKEPPIVQIQYLYLELQIHIKCICISEYVFEILLWTNTQFGSGNLYFSLLNLDGNSRLSYNGVTKPYKLMPSICMTFARDLMGKCGMLRANYLLLNNTHTFKPQWNIKQCGGFCAKVECKENIVAFVKALYFLILSNFGFHSQGYIRISNCYIINSYTLLSLDFNLLQQSNEIYMHNRKYKSHHFYHFGKKLSSL